jgi:hypothetical protein
MIYMTYLRRRRPRSATVPGTARSARDGRWPPVAKTDGLKRPNGVALERRAGARAIGCRHRETVAPSAASRARPTRSWGGWRAGATRRPPGAPTSTAAPGAADAARSVGGGRVTASAALFAAAPEQGPWRGSGRAALGHRALSNGVSASNDAIDAPY